MMMLMRKRLVCCTRDRKISLDFDEQGRIMTYDGLENCIHNNQSYENDSGTSRGDGFVTDSFDDDDSSCSSSKDAFGSFSSKWMTTKKDEHESDEWEFSDRPRNFYLKEKASYSFQSSDVEAMKERFSKLLLGEDVTGGTKGISTASALSNAITNLAASVFGELWKLEPLPEERKNKWLREMDWFLSPTNYMVQLVPAKQNGANGGTLEIMTPQARADIHVNLPALQKLDSMLIGTLDAMVNSEFWYAEGGSRAEGRNTGIKQSKKWRLPSPQVPGAGLSEIERKKLLNQGRVVYQVFKAAKSINESVLLDMPVPAIIKEALHKSGKANLGEELYEVLNIESSAEAMLQHLNLTSEHSVLEKINRLEAAVFIWKERFVEVNGKSPVRTSWSFKKDPLLEMDKMNSLLDRAEALLQQLKIRYPNLPQTFLNAARIQYCKDVGHSILEAYSRVLGNLAFSILSRIGDILEEDNFSNPSSPAATTWSPGVNISETFAVTPPVRKSLTDHMDNVDGRHSYSNSSRRLDMELLSSQIKGSSLTSTPSRSRVWCIGRESCISLSPPNTPRLESNHS